MGLYLQMRGATMTGAPSRPQRQVRLTLRGLARKHQFNPGATRAARADLKEAIRRDPNYAPACAYLAWTNLIDMLLQFTGEWHFSQLGDVIAQFHRAIELDPNFPAPYQGLSQALTYADDIAQSLALARRAVELGPSDADGLIFLANALFELGELAEAMEAAERAMELNPLPPPFYHLYTAMVLWGNERYQEVSARDRGMFAQGAQFRRRRYLSCDGIGWARTT